MLYPLSYEGAADSLADRAPRMRPHKYGLAGRGVTGGAGLTCAPQREGQFAAFLMRAAMRVSSAGVSSVRA